MSVIRVVVREQNGVDVGHSGGNQLHPQLRRRIDQDSRSPVRLHDRPDPRPPIARIR
jgi:hypothetical protein